MVMGLSEAFDIITQDVLLAKLAAYGISLHSLKALKSFLHYRKQVRIGNVTLYVSVVSIRSSTGVRVRAPTV